MLLAMSKKFDIVRHFQIGGGQSVVREPKKFFKNTENKTKDRGMKNTPHLLLPVVHPPLHDIYIYILGPPFFEPSIR